jgi:tetratricopeptide (TPR) repeat protein
LKLLKETRNRFPHRLDIHLGVAHIAHLLNFPDEQFAALKTMARAARIHAGKLRWEREAPIDIAEETEVVWHLHNLALEHYRKKDKEGLKRFFKIAQLMVQEFPKQAMSWNDLSLYYGEIEDWQNRQKVLEKALTIAPDDAVVLFNFGTNSRRLGLPDRAAEAFRKIIELNREKQWVEQAREELKEMGLEKKERPAGSSK